GLTALSVSDFRKISETRARVRVGCQGWNYDDWVTPPPPARAVFYPRATRADRMLDTYARAFDTVEVDSTFYAVPSDATLDAWAAKTPDGFTFALKLPREITHEHALRGARPSKALGSRERESGARRRRCSTRPTSRTCVGWARATSRASTRSRARATRTYRSGPPPSSAFASAARRSSHTSATSMKATLPRAPTNSSACSVSPRSSRMIWRTSRRSFELRSGGFR